MSAAPADLGPGSPVGDDPQHAVATPHGRYYNDPANDGRLMISVTNALSHLAKHALAPAAALLTATWFAERLPEAVRAAADPEQLTDFITRAKSAYRDEWDSRMRLGTRVHRLAEALNLNAPIGPDPEAEPFLDSYRAWLADYGVDLERDVVAAECTVLNRELGYGGTSDLWVWLRFDHVTSRLVPRFRPRKVPPHPQPTLSGLWLIDFKTSVKHLASAIWPEYPLQLAALRNADVALACPPACRYGSTDHHDDGHELPVPVFAGAAVLNLRRDTYGFVPLPADAAAFAAFRALLPVASYLHDQDLRPFKPVQPPIHPPAPESAPWRERSCLFTPTPGSAFAASNDPIGPMGTSGLVTASRTATAFARSS